MKITINPSVGNETIIQQQNIDFVAVEVNENICVHVWNDGLNFVWKKIDNIWTKFNLVEEVEE